MSIILNRHKIWKMLKSIMGHNKHRPSVDFQVDYVDLLIKLGTAIKIIMIIIAKDYAQKALSWSYCRQNNY